MDIIDFYKKLSNILEMRAESEISQKSAESLLKDLNDKAKASNLDVNISTDIFNDLNKFNDERSLEADDSSYSSY